MRHIRTGIDRLALCLLCGLWLNGSLVDAADWPTWRHDANRSATTTGELPDNLQLRWVRQLPPSPPAWPEDPRLHFDAHYEPVVMGKTMFVASSRNDSVTAFDTGTGDRKWRFYASGPVRFAPLCAEGRVYFGADDGFFYCLDADSGTLVWKLQAAPAERKVIGNERLISVWPMRGGPVLLDGWIHFTVGVWPFEGNFHVAVNTRPQTGADASQPEYTVETLSSGLTPQGYLSANDSKMFIPCGRSVAGCFDRQTGKPVKVSYSTRGVTNYHVSTIGPWLFHGAVCYHVPTGKTMQTAAHAPVLADDRFFSGAKGLVRAYDLKHPQTVESKDRRGKTIKKTVLTELWKLQDKSFKDQPVQIDIRVGDRLYGHAGNSLFAVDLPDGKNPARVSWTTTIEHSPVTMLAADDKLFVITDEDQIYAFGAGDGAPKTHLLKQPSSVATLDAWTDKTAEILKQTGTKTGYCVVLGIGSGRLIEELVRQSELQVVAVDPDQEKVEALRRRLDAEDRYGTRVAVHHGDPLSFGLPPYLAQMIVSEDLEAAGFGRPRFVKSVFHVLRPYGGTVCLELADAEHERLTGLVAANGKPSAEVKRVGSLSLLVRAGALPGAADWTHEYADASNTLMSQDRLVKAPLGVLWFGGPSADGGLFYNRHYWGPSMAVIHGRMFIQGPGKLTAVDVYTGRLLWQIPLKERKENRAGRRGNNFEKVIAGFHFVAVDDAVYLVDGREIIRLNPETGEQVSVFAAPPDGVAWGRIRVHDNLLIASVFQNTKKYGKLPTKLVAMDRHSGKTLWTKKADMSFPIVAIGGDKLFCFDGALEDFYQDWKRRGKIPKAADNRFLQAIDLRTGKVLWKERTDIIATWLSYSSEHDVMVVSNRRQVAAFRGKTGAELWKRYNEGKGFRGHPENLWDKVIVWKNQVLDQRGPGQAYDLESGASVMRKHPITGESVPWTFTKSGHHCNYAIASPHLMTFRAASAGYCDIETGTTSRLEGFRSGCRNSLIPADGVLNAPNFAHGCSCGFSLFTSLALVHVPQTEMWSYSALTFDETKRSVRRVGINFGAPGDRLDEHGTLWLDYPNRGGSSPTVSVKVSGTKLRWFRSHSALVKGDLPWVASSGVEGAESISIKLGKSADKSASYTVRLHFLETGESSTGQRLFNVTLQGKTVLKDFNVSQAAGGTNRSVMREFPGVKAGDALTVRLSATAGQPVISGIEIITEAK